MPPKQKMFEQIYNDVNQQINNPIWDVVYKPPKKYSRKSHYYVGKRGYTQQDIMFYPKFPTSETANGYIYVIADMMKPYKVDAEIIRNKRPETVINALQNILNRGIINPKIVWSDPGTEFNNRRFIDYCETKDIDLRFTVPGNKTQNAIVEMMNGFIRQMLMGYNNYMGLQNRRRGVELFMPQFRNFINALNNYFQNNQKALTFEEKLTKTPKITDYDLKHMLKIGDKVYLPRMKNGKQLKFRRGDIRYHMQDWQPREFVISAVLWSPYWDQERYMVSYEDEDGEMEQIKNVSYQRSQLLPV
jgi:hypothetical protein